MSDPTAKKSGGDDSAAHASAVPGKLRQPPGFAWRLFAPLLTVGMILGAWWMLTRGPVETRTIEPGKLPSLSDTLGEFRTLWFDRALTRNAMTSLWRVVKGFGYALLIGVPLGILAGCFPVFGAFLGPITIFGRNVPIAALLPLTMVWFDIGEAQKVGFIFIATVSFVIFDATGAIASVDQKYLDTAYTLGASRGQIIRKVLVPLAMPKIWNSIRLLFGLGFGYIVLAESIATQEGIGALIFISQRLGKHAHVYLSIFFIALIAWGVDRLLALTGRVLFPYLHRR